MTLPVAPAVMVGDEIVVEGSDISDEKLEEIICKHAGIPLPDPRKRDSLDESWVLTIHEDEVKLRKKFTKPKPSKML